MIFDEIKIVLENQGKATLKNKVGQIKDYDCLCFTNGKWHAAQGWMLDSEGAVEGLALPDTPQGELETIINNSGKSDSQKLSDIITWKNAHSLKLQ